MSEKGMRILIALAIAIVIFAGYLAIGKCQNPKNASSRDAVRSDSSSVNDLLEKK